MLLDKDSAFFSKEVATIVCNVPINEDLENMKYTGCNEIELTKLFE